MLTLYNHLHLICETFTLLILQTQEEQLQKYNKYVGIYEATV